MLQQWIDRAVVYCIQHSKLVIAAALLLAALSAIYTARHFAIDTDINNLISERLPWRQNEIAFQRAFPQTIELILVDVAADSPEAAKAAAREVAQALAKKPDLFRSVRDQLDSSFFRRNGLLFLPPDQVAHVTEQLSNAAPLLSGLARDPTLRGLVQALVGIVDYAKQGYVSFDDMARPLNLAAAALEGVAQGHPVEFSWRTLARGDPRPLDLHRFVEVRPVLDHSALEPGGKATAAIREIVSQLGLQAKFGAQTSLTGPVIISDNQFAGVHEGATVNGVVTGVIVLVILGIALRSIGLVAAVVVTLAAGLAMTAAAGIFMVGALNPISLAFAVLFVGLGADFAIQYTVRYRAERHDFGKLDEALIGSAGWVGIPLSLAAGAAAAGFLSFTPTSYRGFAQLGIIAGFGMVVAYVLSLTLLPALIRVFNAPPEPKPLTLPALAPADAFLKRHRLWVVSITVLIVLAGLPALTRLQFNFDPLALENQSSPALRSILRLAKDLPLKTRETAGRSGADSFDCSQARRVARSCCDLDNRQLRPSRPRQKARSHWKSKRGARPGSARHAAPVAKRCRERNGTAARRACAGRHRQPARRRRGGRAPFGQCDAKAIASGSSATRAGHRCLYSSAATRS